MSYITKTVPSVESPKTVTLTRVPQRTTEIITVTIDGAAAAAISTPGALGTVAPVGTAGTGNRGVSSSAAAAAISIPGATGIMGTAGIDTAGVSSSAAAPAPLASSPAGKSTFALGIVDID